MQIEERPFDGVAVFVPRLIEDARGFFYESHTAAALATLGCDRPFVQENTSGSRRRVLRGLHYQLEPAAQGKLVRVTAGAIFDVVVDLRRSSGSFGRWYATTLSAENRRRLWIAPGFAHGFYVVSDFAEMTYAVTAPYSPTCERTLAWDDPALAIPWPTPSEGPILSAKDAAGLSLREIEAYP
jgi:dTDP-4-dehydrorhamnose 3,5-epimerase